MLSDNIDLRKSPKQAKNITNVSKTVRQRLEKLKVKNQMNISYKYRESLKIQQEKVKALDMNKDFIQTVRNIFLIGG